MAALAAAPTRSPATVRGFVTQRPGGHEVDAFQIPPALGNGVGVVALFVWLFVMLARGGLVTRREHDAVKQDRDYWRAIAMKTTSTAEKMAEQKSVGIAAVETIARSAAEKGGAE